MGKITQPEAATGEHDAATPDGASVGDGKATRNSAEPCPCEFAEFALHDALLGIETAGFDTWLSVFEGFSTRGNFVGTPDLPSMGQFPEFVAQHNWRDPWRMFNLASAFAYLHRGAVLPDSAEAVADVREPMEDRLSDRLTALERRMDAISPRAGHLVCRGVEVRDRRKKLRVELFANEDSSGLLVNDIRGDSAVHLSHYTQDMAAISSLSLWAGGQPTICLDAPEGELPSVVVATEVGAAAPAIS